MPDDEQQKEHSQSIATERFLIQQWGVPRNQVRARLHEVARLMAAQRIDQAAQQPAANSAPAPFPKPAEVQAQSRGFYPKPLTLGTDISDQNPALQTQQGGPNTGTFATQYVMGTNSTAVGGPYGPLADNDSWTAAAGPSPTGGGPYDSVTVLSWARIVPLGAGLGFIIYTRGVVFDSLNKITDITVETGNHITGI